MSRCGTSMLMWQPWLTQSTCWACPRRRPHHRCLCLCPFMLGNSSPLWRPKVYVHVTHQCPCDTSMSMYMDQFSIFQHHRYLQEKVTTAHDMMHHHHGASISREDDLCHLVKTCCIRMEVDLELLARRPPTLSNDHLQFVFNQWSGK